MRKTPHNSIPPLEESFRNSLNLKGKHPFAQHFKVTSDVGTTYPIYTDGSKYKKRLSVYNTTDNSIHEQPIEQTQTSVQSH